MEQRQERKETVDWYDKYYKIILIIPAILLILSLGYMVYFYHNEGDILKKDISLSGGTTITVYAKTDITALQTELTKTLGEISVRSISDLRTGSQIAFVIETSKSPEEAKPIIENYLGYKLDDNNSSIEFTGPALSTSFYKELRIAVLIAFILMALVVFIIFGLTIRSKIIVTLLTLAILIIIWKVGINLMTGIAILLISATLVYMYIRYSMPSFAVVLSAFADIIMPLALVNFFGMEISSAGIVAFIMLIGYSVDTDILLTSRLLKRSGEPLNTRLYGAFKTGMTMTLTAIASVVIALAITSGFSETLKQMFTIISIGLFFDIINTWITNASILKWYCEKRGIR